MKAKKPIPQFIVIETFVPEIRDAAVKSLSEYLSKKKIKHITIDEDMCTTLAKGVGTILASERYQVNAIAEVFLLLAARLQNVQEKIIPELQKGNWVISGGFEEALHAFSGGGAGIEESYLNRLETYAYGDFKPAFVYFLDVPVPDIARLYAIATGDKLPKDSLDFYDRSRKIWLKRAQGNKNAVLLDGTLDNFELSARMIQTISYLI